MWEENTEEVWKETFDCEFEILTVASDGRCRVAKRREWIHVLDAVQFMIISRPSYIITAPVR